MKTLKSFTVMAMAVVLTLALVACGGNAGSSSSSSSGGDNASASSASAGKSSMAQSLAGLDGVTNVEAIDVSGSQQFAEKYIVTFE